MAFSIIPLPSQGSLESLLGLLETTATIHLSFYFYPFFFYLPYVLRTRQQTLKYYHRGETFLRLNNFKVERST